MFIEDYRSINWEDIAALPADTAPQWGQMWLQHMIEHLTDVFMAANGTYKAPVTTPADKLEKIRNVVLFSDREFQRNAQSPVLPQTPAPFRNANMSAAVDALRAEIAKYEKHYAADKNITENHPVFGPLNYEEWEVFQKKHFTHHLKQFGLWGS